jgi:CDGSH-type Zn-finger protein/uncharacterized Fe-S cluster protein YjdI
MADKFKKYPGKEVDIEYSATRCIHAARCVQGLPEVFNPDARPWINANAAPAAKIAQAVRTCPTGALRLLRGEPETPDAKNTAALVANGPLHLRGRITLELAKPQAETRCALCRCGASHNKPFCDNSHEEIRFKDDGGTQLSEVKGALIGDDQLKITPLPNGPLQIEGVLSVLNAKGASVHLGEKCFLCRCGSSRNKPHCDGSHAQAGFKS